MVTMRTLYLLRHAKTEWPQGVDDRERPLSAQGLVDARALAGRMAAERYRPGFVLCSPAKRTRETFEILRETMPDLTAHFDDRLYLANTGPLYEDLKAVDDGYESVLLIGHNPGLHGLVRFLAGQGDSGLMMRILSGYPAGCLAVVHCGCESWSGLMPAANRLEALLGGEEIA